MNSTTHDVTLYVNDEASVALVRRLTIIFGEPAAPLALDGVLFATRVARETWGDPPRFVRETLLDKINEIDWGAATGVLTVHEPLYRDDDTDYPQSVRVPQYPAPRPGRVVTSGRELCPGRWYFDGEDVPRRYLYREGGFEGWEYLNETTAETDRWPYEHKRVPVANHPGPWTETTYRVADDWWRDRLMPLREQQIRRISDMEQPTKADVLGEQAAPDRR